MESKKKSPAPKEYYDSWLGKKIFQFECLFSLHMLEPNEKWVICILKPLPTIILLS